MCAPNMTAAIVGWAHLPFGKHADETVESMVVKVTNQSLAHAGIDLEPGADDKVFLLSEVPAGACPAYDDW